jgi:hypothetical protein
MRFAGTTFQYEGKRGGENENPLPEETQGHLTYFLLQIQLTNDRHRSLDEFVCQRRDFLDIRRRDFRLFQIIAFLPQFECAVKRLGQVFRSSGDTIRNSYSPLSLTRS